MGPRFAWDMASNTAIDLRPDDTPEEYWQPTSWKPLYTYICQLYAILHLPAEEIAKTAGLSRNRVYHILGDARGRAEIQKATDSMASNLIDVQHQFKLYSEEALTELVRQMRYGKKGDDEIKQGAATKILDRAGYTPIHKHISMSANISEDVVDRLQSAMRDFEMIDADYTILDDPDADPDSTEDDLNEVEDTTEEEYLRRVEALRKEATG